jgi:hypothetical protein
MQRALPRPCAPCGHHQPPPCPAHLLTTGVWTNALCVTSTQGRCHYNIAVVPYCAHVHLPLSLLAQACVAPTQCAAIREDPPVHLSLPPPLPPSDKPSPPHPPLFSAAPSVPSHLTPPLSLYAGPRAVLEPRAAPQPEGRAPPPPLSSGAVDRAGEFCPSVARLPHFELGLSTVPGKCTVGWGSLQYKPY